MVNGTNFKLYGELPVFRPTRHCCGIIQNPFLASFFFMSSALVGVFVWSLTNPQITTPEYRLAVRKGVSNALLALFHGYYTYVIFCLWEDTRKKRLTEEFIARQHMIDDVCEEMMWEEEEAKNYAEMSFHRNFPMSGIYQAEDGSLYTYSQSSDCSVSLCSAEITINTMYQAYQQDRRFVTFYEDDGHCGYY
ncbi:hypothetical protein CAEBREN_29229 [Caenorhabditis brenneri]|uniref:Uncharacterized protein n=1 Tax=Caenorhabditis brenneri TaxID=135651 RepID=G0MWP0_CAEBE|nr:hypothetical protein CAEBREN_29229 [Caenorhabditis brenneri]